MRPEGFYRFILYMVTALLTPNPGSRKLTLVGSRKGWDRVTHLCY